MKLNKARNNEGEETTSIDSQFERLLDDLRISVARENTFWKAMIAIAADRVISIGNHDTLFPLVSTFTER